MKLLADFAARSFSSLKGLLGAMALVGVLSLTLAAAPLPAMAEEGGSASDENATQTVTVYHFEMVYYDDPTFEDWGVPELTGLRLIGTSTVEGLKPGDVVRAWDQVGTHPGFAFFDGWPRELTVSEDPSENAIQMNYIRQSSEVTVNYYEASLLDNMAAMPLYGHELTEEITPLEAGLDPFVKMNKADFIGKAALEAKGEPTRRRVGLKVTGRGIIREGAPLLAGDRPAGVSTSGTHCPYLGYPVAMALVEKEFAQPGQTLTAQVRGRQIEAQVVALPFYKRNKG